MVDQPAPPKDGATQEEPDDNEPPSLVPRAWFGTATTPLPDPAEGEEEDPDDEELDETPPDVVQMLGFDPKDEAESDDPDDEDIPDE